MENGYYTHCIRQVNKNDCFNKFIEGLINISEITYYVFDFRLNKVVVFEKLLLSKLKTLQPVLIKAQVKMISLYGGSKI